MRFGSISITCLLTLTLLSACGGGGSSNPPHPPPEPITVTQEQLAVPVDMASNYLLYLPKEYGQDPERKWPLMIFLHGSQPLANLTLANVSQQGLMGYMNSSGNAMPAIVVQPLQDVNIHDHRLDWHDPVFIDAVIRDVEARYSVDKTRVSLSGASMGGFASWELALAFPNRFAAVMPVVGGLSNDTDSYDRHLPITTQEDWGTTFNRLQTVPFRVYTGSIDQNVPILWARNPKNMLAAVTGNQQDYRELNLDHFATQTAAFSTEPINWMLNQVRPEADENVTPITASDYTGTYHFKTAGTAVTVSELNGMLVLTFGGDRKPLPFFPISDDRFMGPWMMRALRDSQDQVKCLVTPIIFLKTYPMETLLKDGATESCQ